mmetsp:Transcript_27251/g.57871  ORF Transcript_27251/g.57871 Transcript_27251/m.57871 type:complete len:130 (+) Transcript_27251:202-591(+)
MWNLREEWRRKIRQIGDDAIIFNWDCQAEIKPSTSTLFCGTNFPLNAILRSFMTIAIFSHDAFSIPKASTLYHVLRCYSFHRRYSRTKGRHSPCRLVGGRPRRRRSSSILHVRSCTCGSLNCGGRLPIQ